MLLSNTCPHCGRQASTLMKAFMDRGIRPRQCDECGGRIIAQNPGWWFVLSLLWLVPSTFFHLWWMRMLITILTFALLGWLRLYRGRFLAYHEPISFSS